MKKLICIALALVMTLALAVTCFAADAENLQAGQNATNDVTVTYAPGNTVSTKVYAVDVTFGALSFEYTSAGNSGWDTENHEYTPTEASWSAEGNTVEVTNHSNDRITATFSIAFGEVTTVTATYAGEGVDGNVLTLASAETTGNEVTGVVTVTLGGSIEEDEAGTFTLTVAIAAAVAAE